MIDKKATATDEMLKELGLFHPNLSHKAEPRRPLVEGGPSEAGLREKLVPRNACGYF